MGDWTREFHVNTSNTTSNQQASRTAHALTAQNARSKRGAPVMRILQLDAHSLDSELTNMLQQRLFGAFSLFSPTTIDNVKPELELALSAALYGLSIGMGAGTTPGMAMMNLRYRNETAVPLTAPNAGTGFPLTKSQKIMFGVGVVVVPYAWQRFQRITSHWAVVSQSDWRHRAWRIVQKLETCLTVLRTFHFIAFLSNGMYHGLIQRLLRIRAVYKQPQNHRFVSFDMLNQQLLWFAVTDFIQAMVPVLHLNRIWRKIRTRIASMRHKVTTSLTTTTQNTQTQHTAPTPTNTKSSNSNSNINIKQIERMDCGVCGSETPCMPQVTDCGCVYCYMCIMTHIAENQESNVDRANNNSTSFRDDVVCVSCGENIRHVRWLTAANTKSIALEGQRKS